MNGSAWSPSMQVDRVCSPVPLMQITLRLPAALGNEMSLWPTHIEEGRSIPGAEPIRRISVLSSFNWSLFWTTQTFTSKTQDSMVRARVNASEGESDLYSSVSSANVWWETEWCLSNYIRKRLSIQNKKNWSQDRALGDPTSQKRRRWFYFIYSYCLCPTLQVRIKERQIKKSQTPKAFSRWIEGSA